MILIVSNKWDITVDFVVRELHRRGIDYLRLNTEDLAKYECTSVSDTGQLTLPVAETLCDTFADLIACLP
jgi:hypothetical protein